VPQLRSHLHLAATPPSGNGTLVSIPFWTVLKARWGSFVCERAWVAEGQRCAPGLSGHSRASAASVFCSLQFENGDKYSFK
jgi:hypothetical protein